MKNMFSTMVMDGNVLSKPMPKEGKEQVATTGGNVKEHSGTRSTDKWKSFLVFTYNRNEY